MGARRFEILIRGENLLYIAPQAAPRPSTPPNAPLV
jgi:hypothetical protein